MAKRRKYKHVVDPMDKAGYVVATYIKKYKEEGDDWAKKYKGHIKEYVEDETKKLRALVALAGYYAGFTPEVKSAIREAVGRAVANKDKVLAEWEKGAREKGIVPPRPKEAEELVKKVAEVITI